MKTTDLEPVTVGGPRATVIFSVGEGYPASNAQWLDVQEPRVPESFYRALADVKAGRVVDVEKAHNEVPPFKLG